MVWVLFWLLVEVLWRGSYLHSLHLEVCVEGHDTGYDLHDFSWSWLSSWMFSFTYIRFEICWRLWSLVCIHVCHVRDGMVIPLSLSFIGYGELGRVLETYYESFSCSLLVYVLWISLRLHGFTSLRCCEWVSYKFDIIFCSGSFLMYMCQVLLLRLVIAGYRLDMLMMWD